MFILSHYIYLAIMYWSVNENCGEVYISTQWGFSMETHLSTTWSKISGTHWSKEKHKKHNMYRSVLTSSTSLRNVEKYHLCLIQWAL